MKVMILGATGMLGHRLMLRLSEEFEVVGTMRGSLPVPAQLSACRIIPDIDANSFSIQEVLDHEKPDVLINCIGIIKQLEEAKDPLKSIAINSLLPHQLALLCRARGVWLIHFSTDCVFSGSQGFYLETSPPDAQDLYGRTKLLGEVGGEGCLTLRTSIIGHEIRGGRGLIEWFLSQKSGQVRGYTGALYSGLTTNEMAELVAMLLGKYPKLTGIWHVASDPISKYDLLCLVNDVYELGVMVERDTDFHCDRRLNADAFREATGYRAPSWEDMIRKMHDDAVICGEDEQ